MIKLYSNNGREGRISYKSHFKSLRNYLKIEPLIDDLTKTELENMVARMRDLGLAVNFISSYVRVLKTFLSWCNSEGITQINMPRYKSEGTIAVQLLESKQN